MGHSNQFILVLVFVYKLLLRYDQGREDGAVIDDWEDPNFEIYHTQDRYPPTKSILWNEIKNSHKSSCTYSYPYGKHMTIVFSSNVAF